METNDKRRELLIAFKYWWQDSMYKGDPLSFYAFDKFLSTLEAEPQEGWATTYGNPEKRGWVGISEHENDNLKAEVKKWKRLLADVISCPETELMCRYIRAEKAHQEKRMRELGFYHDGYTFEQNINSIIEAYSRLLPAPPVQEQSKENDMKNSEQPTFPITTKERHPTFGEHDFYHFGLTKREYLAAMAMQGLLTNMGNGSFIDYLKPEPDEHIANMSIDLADALLKELESNPSKEK